MSHYTVAGWCVVLVVLGAAMPTPAQAGTGECESSAPLFVGPTKSRYLSLESVGALGVRSAIRVTFGENEPFPELAGQSLWVGPPRAYPEEDSSQPGLTFVAGGLSCTPHYRDWSTIDVLQVYGAEITPQSMYDVQLINEGCPTSVEANFSVSLVAETGKWGDIELLFASPGGPAQPSFKDIAASVKKFQAAPDAPIKAQAQLGPNAVKPSRSMSFYGIALVVAAFEGSEYKDLFDGSCACPSAVTCGATPCAIDLSCSPGVCIDGACTDVCGRCAP